MTREEKQKAIDALKISAPVMVVTQEEFNDYIQTLNQVTGRTATGGVICSECGYKTHNKAHIIFGCPFNYCPNCGCRMVEPQESEE